MAGEQIQIADLSKKELRDFGLVTGAIFAGLFGLLIPWIFEHGYPRWPWYVFAALALPALIVPNVLQPVYKVWMRFGLLISKITTPLILGLVFFVIITPFGLVRRLVAKDAMARKLDSGTDSYRVASNKSSTEGMERPF